MAAAAPGGPAAAPEGRAAARLRRLRESLDGPATIGELAARLGREGVGLLVVLAAVPFLHPLPTAGLATPFGLVFAAVGVQLALGRDEPPLPGFVARRRLEADFLRRLLGAAEKVVAVLERLARPRWSAVARSPRLLGGTIALLGAVFAVPIFFPLGTLTCAIPLVLLGLALLEDDGLLGTLGLAATLLALAYHAALARYALGGARALWGRLG